MTISPLHPASSFLLYISRRRAARCFLETECSPSSRQAYHQCARSHEQVIPHKVETLLPCPDLSKPISGADSFLRSSSACPFLLPACLLACLPACQLFLRVVPQVLEALQRPEFK